MGALNLLHRGKWMATSLKRRLYRAGGSEPRSPRLVAYGRPSFCQAWNWLLATGTGRTERRPRSLTPRPSRSGRLMRKSVEPLRNIQTLVGLSIVEGPKRDSSDPDNRLRSTVSNAPMAELFFEQPPDGFFPGQLWVPCRGGFRKILTVHSHRPATLQYFWLT